MITSSASKIWGKGRASHPVALRACEVSLLARGYDGSDVLSALSRHPLARPRSRRLPADGTVRVPENGYRPDPAARGADSVALLRLRADQAAHVREPPAAPRGRAGPPVRPGLSLVDTGFCSSARPAPPNQNLTYGSAAPISGWQPSTRTRCAKFCLARARRNHRPTLATI